MGKSYAIDSTYLTTEQINHIQQRIAYLEVQGLIEISGGIKTRIILGIITEDDIAIINELLSLKTHCFIGPLKVF